jgi:hypothetical protein
MLYGLKSDAKRDELLIVNDGRDGRTRSIRLTSVGAAKVKATEQGLLENLFDNISLQLYCCNNK